MSARTPSGRTRAAAFLTLLALLIGALPASAEGDDAACDATPDCAVSFATTQDCRVMATLNGNTCEGTCGVNLTANGETCLHASRLAVTTPVRGVHVTVEEEDTTGNTSLTNTRNAWTSDRVTATVHGDDAEARLVLTLLASDQEPSAATTRQILVGVDADVLGLAHGAGAGARFYDGLPRWCGVTTPLGRVTLDCSLDPVRYLLP